MLQLRPAQLAAFESAMTVAATNRSAVSLRVLAPAHAAMSSPSSLEIFAQQALGDAQAIGFRLAAASDFYVYLASRCGIGVAQDPQYAFLGIPKSLGYRRELGLADSLHRRLMRYLDNVWGKDCELAAQALALGNDYTQIAQGPADTRTILAQLESIWPQKVSFVGKPLLYHALRDELRPPDPLHLPPLRRALLVAFFGVRWRSDPLFDWLQRPFAQQTEQLLYFLGHLQDLQHRGTTR